jgi:hypothetical protein
MVRVVQLPQFAAAMQAGGCESLGSTREGMANLIASETSKFAKIAKEGNVTVE